ncbi:MULTISPECIES: hypothetical protein [Sulfolobaceae]|uniref:hypothetical protein n=1 Tax=Sulfolobaceae TaxID=118883 RepID=UPI001E444D55|nr:MULTISPECIES: hypothetical protein [unclassified Sulfolobus]
MIKITSVNGNIIEGLVPARCALGYYHVKVRISGYKIESSECECGEKICKHAIQLFLHYQRTRK